MKRIALLVAGIFFIALALLCLKPGRITSQMMVAESTCPPGWTYIKDGGDVSQGLPNMCEEEHYGTSSDPWWAGFAFLALGIGLLRARRG
jgi:hypothetical protein